jgi:hypothetical protein
MNKIILSANDIKEISKVIEEITEISRVIEKCKVDKVDYFTLTRNNVSAIGYSIDLEYSTTINGRMCTVIVPVVGINEW